MHWPRPVPVLWWVGDYTDIRERIKRQGRFDIDEVWLPDSDDSYGAFCRRHGTHHFAYDYMAAQQAERDALHGARRRHHEVQAERVRLAQEAWEAERRQRQQEKQAEADREWGEAGDIAKARAFWSEVDAAYTEQQYHLVVLRKEVRLYDTVFFVGRPYWVPTAVMFGIRGHGGL